jgi:hypothetical protein
MSSPTVTPDQSSPDSGLAAGLGGSQPTQPAAQPQPEPTAPIDSAVGVNPAADMAAQINNLPSTQPDDLPRFKRTIGSTLKGMLIGLAGGGIPGAVAGAASPTGAVARQQQIQHFQSAQSAKAIADARADEVRAQNLPQQLQDAHTAAADQHVANLKSLYGAPDMVIDNDDSAASEAIQHAAANGGVPLAHLETVGDKTYVWNAAKAADNSNALSDIQKWGTLTGNPGMSKMTSDYYDSLPAADKASLWHQAQAQLMPVTADKDPVVRAGQIAEAKRELNTVSELPDADSNKQFLVAKAQNDFDRLGAADDAFTDAQSQEDARATANAGSKAGAIANAQEPSKEALENAKAQNKANAANATAGEWKPKVTADEKKKAELAENIAENSNSVAQILMKRPDLVGAVAGRFTNAEQMMGNNDPDIAALGTRIHNIAMANSGVHGFRSQEGVESFEHQVLNNFRNGPRAVAGALKATTGSVQTFIDNARPETYKTHSKQGGATLGMAGQ